MLNRWKKKFEKLFIPVGRVLGKLPIGPNEYSFLGLLMAFVAAYFIITQELLLAALFLILSGAFDLIDGLVARLKNLVTTFGGVLDSVLDRYSDLIILGAIIIAGYVDVLWGIIAIAGSFMVSYTRARIEVTGLKMSGVGLFERPERLLLIIVGFLIEYFQLIPTYNVIYYVVVFLAIITNISVLQRMIYGYKHLTRKDAM